MAARTLKGAGYDRAALSTMPQRPTTEQGATDPIDAIHARLLETLLRGPTRATFAAVLCCTVHGVSSPSGEYRATTVGNRLVLNVPTNWHSVHTGTTVTRQRTPSTPTAVS